MREILFRGKTCNGEWVQGHLCKDEFGKIYIIHYVPNKYKNVLPDREVILVDPETVGQFTGMTDKNGKEIFEGDVVAFTRVNALGWNTHRVGEVRYYDELPIFYIMASTGDAWDWVDCENIEVIGNIFDNKELLEN